MALPNVKYVPNERLYVSEPDPTWFGNGRNTPEKEGWTNKNWLKSRFHFNFAEYMSPYNLQFGVMRVMNDDLVQPARGFGTHPHRDMEIVTYVVDGALTHQDSMGTKETLGRGSIQFMTAGTGVRHSEYNLDDKTPLRFIQTWITPRARGLEPNYGSMRGEDVEQARQNQWAHLLSDNQDAESDTPVKIAQDCNMYVSEMEPELALSVPVNSGRMGYMLCMEGSLTLSHAEDDAQAVTMERHDAAEIRGSDDTPLKVKAGAEGAHVLIFEMAEGPGGRTDF